MTSLSLALFSVSFLCLRLFPGGPLASSLSFSLPGPGFVFCLLFFPSSFCLFVWALILERKVFFSTHFVSLGVERFGRHPIHYRERDNRNCIVIVA